VLRRRLNEAYTFEHPENPSIRGLSHILWTGLPTVEGAHARNAVFYGDKAIDRSPCGTGTSARMAQLHAKGRLNAGDDFVHESIIGSLFKGRVEREVELAGRKAIIPSVGGWARMTGYNTIFIDERDPFAHGFVVA
jgi:4-hydroxyproline epimerase